MENKGYEDEAEIAIKIAAGLSNEISVVDEDLRL